MTEQEIRQIEIACTNKFFPQTACFTMILKQKVFESKI